MDLTLASSESSISGVAVFGQRIRKSYRTHGKKLEVLRGLDINVPNGAIYGLLGPSGCGKTTLLRCFLGRLKVDAGDVIVLGHPPNTPGNHIPGKKVGYMPQETALFVDFTIEEHLEYFGKLHGMTSADIKARTAFLIHLLELPEKGRLVRTLSGGQQRRVSFAVALLQEPPLLILDEPTVGVDPLLRAKIWKYLRQVASQSKTTIMITTHYIEEARQADMVGLMRDGKILAEAEPNFLMQEHGFSNLEDVFLKLCKSKEGEEEEEEEEQVSVKLNSPLNIQSQNSGGDLDEKTPLLTNNFSPSANQKIMSGRAPRQTRTFASYAPSWKNVTNTVTVVWKNFARFKRNPGLLLFQFLLPSIQIILFCLAIGANPKHLSVSIVNLDEGLSLGGNHSLNLGDSFVRCLDNETIHKVMATSNESARHQATLGHTIGVIFIPENFTVDLIQRFLECSKADNATLVGSTVEVSLDLTDEQVAIMLEQAITNAYEKFVLTVAKEAPVAVNPEALTFPVEFAHPIYGDPQHSTFTDFVTPGILISISFGMAIGLTAITFIVEKKEGLLDRSWVAGVSVVEMVIAHTLTQFLVILVQMLLLVLFALVVFKVRCEGSVALVFFLAILQGMTGMSFGLLVSAVCDTELSAMQIAMGAFYPVLLLSGILWPLQAMPTWLKYISYAFPTTHAAQAMRSIFGRGWGLSWVFVWKGYVISFGWLVGLLILAAIGLKRQK